MEDLGDKTLRMLQYVDELNENGGQQDWLGRRL